MIQEFITNYGTQILYAIITGIAGYVGLAIKNICKTYVNDKTKQKVARTVVRAVKQMYSDMNGEEKLDMAISNISEMLVEKGISITELEIRMLIEAAVEELKEAATGTEVITNGNNSI